MTILSDFSMGGVAADFKGNALLLKAADFLEGKVNEISGLPDELKDGFAAVLDAFTESDTPQEIKDKIKEALTELEDVAEEKLKNAVETYVAKFGVTLPEDWDDFAKKVSSFQGSATEIDWQLLNLGGSTDLLSKNEDRSFVLSGEAQATLNFGAGVSLPEEVDGQAAGDENIVSLGLTGKLGGKAALALPVASANTDINRNLDLDYYFHANGNDRLGEVIVSVLDDVVSPFSLKRIWEQENLTAVRYESKHGVKFGAEFELKKGFELAGTEVGVGLTVGASAFRQGEAEIVAWRAAADEVRVAVNRKAANTDTSSLGLSVGIDLSALVGKVNAILKDVQGKYADVLTQFDKYTKPGGLIKEELKKAWDGLDSLSGDEKGLLLSVIGFDGGKSGQEALTDLLEAKILTYKNALDEDVEDASKDISDAVFSTLGIKKSLYPELSSKIEAVLKDGLEGVHSGLTEEIKGLTDDVLGDLFDKLQNVGQKLASLPDQADATAANLVAPVREVLQKYYDVLGKIVDITKKTNEAKLKIDWQREEKNISGNEADLVVSFKASDELFSTDQCNAYEAITRGSLDGIYKILRDEAAKPDDQKSVVIEGRLKKFAQKTTTTGLHVSLLGFDLGSTSIIDVATQIEIDTSVEDGTIMVVTKSQLEKHFGALFSDEVRKLKMTNVMRLAETAKNPSLNNSFRLWQEDKSLKMKEVTGFLRGLKDAALLPQSAYQDVIDDYSDHVAADDGKAPQGTLTVGFDMTSAHLHALLNIGASLSSKETDYRNIIKDTLASRGLDHKGRVKLIKGLKKAEKYGVSGGENFRFLSNVDLNDEAQVEKATRDLITTVDENLFAKIRRDASNSVNSSLKKIRRLAHWPYKCNLLQDAFWQMLIIMRDVYDEGNEIDVTSKQQELIDGFNEKQAALAKLYAKWLKINKKWLVSIPDEIRPETIAFICSFRNLIGADAPEMTATINFEPVDI